VTPWQHPRRFSPPRPPYPAAPWPPPHATSSHSRMRAIVSVLCLHSISHLCTYAPSSVSQVNSWYVVLGLRLGCAARWVCQPPPNVAWARRVACWVRRHILLLISPAIQFQFNQKTMRAEEAVKADEPPVSHYLKLVEEELLTQSQYDSLAERLEMELHLGGTHEQEARLASGREGGRAGEGVKFDNRDTRTLDADAWWCEGRPRPAGWVGWVGSGWGGVGWSGVG
jgi:hypothetical protein